ncbi:hypothetical protein SAY87_001639 [Trapa incisa]|uniref:Strictosidine synthase conserved region domain-containing protein n=1 Tax=Trapa incisa TaxID=236973 RepID=A0AAN7JVL7_9MYRT|nr:hypothetical protein SAY87_001639 [Trapa incisa]
MTKAILIVSSSFPILLTLLFFTIFFFLDPSAAHDYKLISVSSKRRYHRLPFRRVVGPESIAFDCRGQGPYVGVSDGRILKWHRKHWTDLSLSCRNRKLCDGSTRGDMEPTCGRPLGLKFNNKTCSLYIADAYYGLLKVGPRGGVAQSLAISADGLPFRFTNALDIDTRSGVVYFTDSSRLYQRKEFLKSLLSGDSTGRLLKYNPRTKKVTTLLRGLAFPNGVALSKDKSYLLLAETGNFQILRYWLSGRRAGTSEPFAQLARYPDNIKSTESGDFWVAFESGREVPMMTTANSSLVMDGKKQQQGGGVSDDDIPWFTKDPVAVKFRGDGKAMEILDGLNEKYFESVSEVLELEGNLWVGSVLKPFLGKLRALKN